MVLFDLVYRHLPDLKFSKLHYLLRCTASSSEVPTPFKRGARATELESFCALILSGAVVKEVHKIA